jgi:hypothetical protein
VKKDTSVTYEQDSTESTESLNTPIEKMLFDSRPTWSPITDDNKASATVAATRYSHEEDSYGLNDLSWKKVEKQRKWEDRV